MKRCRRCGRTKVIDAFHRAVKIYDPEPDLYEAKA